MTTDLQIQKEYTYLKDSFIRGGLNILGLLREAENILKDQQKNIDKFLESCREMEKEMKGFPDE